MSTTAASLGQFLHALYGGTQGVIELRAPGHDDPFFFRLGDDAALTTFLGRNLRRGNIYFGVATRKDPKMESSKIVFISRPCSAIRLKGQDEDSVRTRLGEFPFPPAYRSVVRHRAAIFTRIGCCANPSTCKRATARHSGKPTCADSRTRWARI